MLGFCSASGRCFPSSSTVSGRGPRSSCGVIMRQSSRGVAVQASSTGQKGMEGTVEMYVADGTLDWEAGQLIESPRRKVKTPPRVDGETVPERPRLSATPVRVGEALATSEDPVVIKQTYRTERVELAMKSSELQAARLELAEARALIREKEAEMAKMKKLLVQRDVHVTRVKAELIETQLQLQQKEAKLEEAYQALTEAAHERTELRRMLVEAEQNLAVTRSELMRWSDGMAELKMVMDELQDDDWSPQWPSENGAGLNGNGARVASSSAVNGNGAGPLEEEEEQQMDEALLSVLQELKALSSAAMQDADTDELMWSNSSYLSDR